MRFNDKLRLLREARGFTQAQLAERAHLSRSAISLFESGARRVAYDDAPILAEALGVDKSVFDQDELWKEYEEAVEQAKAILLGGTGSSVNTSGVANDISPTGGRNTPENARNAQIAPSYHREFAAATR